MTKRAQVVDTPKYEVVWEWYLVIWYKCLMDRKDTQIVRKDKESLKLLRKSSLRANSHFDVLGRGRGKEITFVEETMDNR